MDDEINGQSQGSTGKVEVISGTKPYITRFIFTSDGFCPDVCPETLSAEEQELLARFESDRYQALYRMGLVERRSGLSPSAAFLYLLSDTFLKS